MVKEALRPMLYGFFVWIALTATVMGLIAYRYFVALAEDDNVHLADSEAPLIAQQTAMAVKLDRIDKLSRQLSLLALGFGLVLGTVFAYDALQKLGLV